VARSLDREDVELEWFDSFIYSADESPPLRLAVGRWPLYDTISVEQDCFDLHVISLRATTA